MNEVISCRGIVKRFKRGKQTFDALGGVSFELEPGQIAGLLGPDGAGKSTLLRILTGLLKPDDGNATVLGFDCVRQPAKIQQRVGYLPQKFGLYENLTVHENMVLYAELHAVPRDVREKRIHELLVLTGLERFPDRQAGHLSGGMKSKLALACSLVSTPRLLILDEPTVGVDVMSRRELWKMLREIAETQKVSVLVSTSYMDEADFCDSVLVLFNGKVLGRGTPESIRAYASGIVENPTFEQGFQMLIAGDVPPPLKRECPPKEDARVMIQADQLVKKFGSFTAVDHISFEVKQGEIFGLLGANGAGKTTTFRMLCGLDPVTEGTVKIAGLDLRKSPGRARNCFGFVAQKFSLYTDLNVHENLEFFGGAYGLYGNKLQERIRWAIHEFAMEDYEFIQPNELPLGIKQRLSMACALLHEPEILFLDEATSGADPMTRREFWARIMKLADQGTAVVITTHFLDEAEFCDRMIIMQDGKSAAAGSAAEIRRQGTIPGHPEPKLEDAFVNIILADRNRQEGNA